MVIFVHDSDTVYKVYRSKSFISLKGEGGDRGCTMNRNTAYMILAGAAGIILGDYIPYSNIVGCVLVGVGIVGLLQK